MGTRADFYVGKGKNAEWLGSIAWDGYREGIPGYILKAKREADFRKAVAKFFSTRDDVTLPERGWPWPWNSSDTTDCSYWFFNSKCWDAVGNPDKYAPCDKPYPYDDEDEGKKRLATLETVEFPDMSARKNVRMDRGSGLIIVTTRQSP